LYIPLLNILATTKAQRVSNAVRGDSFDSRVRYSAANVDRRLPRPLSTTSFPLSTSRPIPHYAPPPRIPNHSLLPRGCLPCRRCRVAFNSDGKLFSSLFDLRLYACCSFLIDVSGVVISQPGPSCTQRAVRLRATSLRLGPMRSTALSRPALSPSIPFPLLPTLMAGLPTVSSRDPVRQAMGAAAPDCLLPLTSATTKEDPLGKVICANPWGCTTPEDVIDAPDGMIGSVASSFLSACFLWLSTFERAP
jgi:hypothetical protein